MKRTHVQGLADLEILIVGDGLLHLQELGESLESLVTNTLFY